MGVGDYRYGGVMSSVFVDWFSLGVEEAWVDLWVALGLTHEKAVSMLCLCQLPSEERVNSAKGDC